MEHFCQTLNATRQYVNVTAGQLEPWLLMLATVWATLVFLEVKEFLWQDESIVSRLKKFAFRTVRRLPIARDKIAKEMDKARISLEHEVIGANAGMPFIQHLPKTGLSRDDILQETEKYTKLGQSDWLKGRVSGTVYNYDPEVVSLVTDVYGKCAWANPLHHDVFPGVHKMEAEVVRMVCGMYHGGPETCGVLTTGGTESIIMACKAYRDRALSLGIKRPQFVVPVTAHAAFDKAASLMNAKIIHVPVDPVTSKVNINAMRKAITNDTCMLAASAPHFPHGIMDPVEEVAKLGVKYKIPVHVDACLGGFLIPFMEKAGFPLPPFDFRVPGVTSISCDTHKYGCAPKGTSVLIYKNREMRHFQYFVTPDWPGGIYASPSIPGSRSGGVIATCWSTMLHYGEEGYVEMTKKLIHTAKKIKLGVQKIPHLFLVGDPLLTVIAFASNDFNIYRLSDEMTKKGWNLNALQYPSSIHICLTMMHTVEGIAEQFLQDVQDAVRDILKDPECTKEGTAALYGMAHSIPDRTMVSQITYYFLDACYATPISAEPHSFANGKTNDHVSKKTD